MTLVADTGLSFTHIVMHVNTSFLLSLETMSGTMNSNLFVFNIKSRYDQLLKPRQKGAEKPGMLLFWCRSGNYLYLKHSSTNDEDSFFFSIYPLYDLICALRKAGATCIWPCNAVEFEKWCDPNKRYWVAACTMQNFQMCMFCMSCSVKTVIQG